MIVLLALCWCDRDLYKKLCFSTRAHLLCVLGRAYFVKVISTGTKAVAAGFGHSMIVRQDDSVWATGWNLYGQFGDGSITSTENFIKVAKLSDDVVHGVVTRMKHRFPSDLPVTTRDFDPGEKRGEMISCSPHVFCTLCAVLILSLV